MFMYDILEGTTRELRQALRRHEYMMMPSFYSGLSLAWWNV